jgi:DNA-binding Xre family transcriptional regulator
VNRVINYNKLWKLLIDRGLNKTELQRLTGISSATITKLAKNETVNTRVLATICNVLECDTSDIMEMADKVSIKTRVARV